MKNERPIIAITMGDPASIGPEIAVKALLEKKIGEICRPLIVGDAGVMKQIISLLGLKAEINSINAIEQARFEYGVIDVWDLGNVEIDKLVFGEISAMAGDASFQAVKKAIELAMENR